MSTLLLYFISISLLQMNCHNIVYDDSDLLSLYISYSSLPIEPSGLGVFARYNIPANEILCEYRGRVLYPKNFTEEDINQLSNKIASTISIEGTEYAIDGDSVCALINDCAWIIGRHYSPQELNYMEQNNIPLPPYPGYKYNTKFIKTKLGKIFIQSIEDIPKDSEVFYPYGL